MAPAITVDQRRSAWKPDTTATGSLPHVLHGAQASLGERDLQARAADEEHRRTVVELLAQQPRRGLGGGDDVGVRDVDPQLAQVLGDRVGWPGGVVGDVGEVHAGLGGVGEVGRGARHRVGADVHDPVEVEHRDVVRRPTGRRGWPSARSGPALVSGAGTAAGWWDT